MIRVRYEHPLPMPEVAGETFSMIIYELVPPHTLLNCRLAIQDRHVGLPWGL